MEQNQQWPGGVLEDYRETGKGQVVEQGSQSGRLFGTGKGKWRGGEVESERSQLGRLKGWWFISKAQGICY